MKNSSALTISLARRLAQSDGRNQQSAIIQTAARLIDQGAAGEDRWALDTILKATPAERQKIINAVEVGIKLSL